MVIHCKLEVTIPKWLMRAGKVMFMAVSTITSQKDMMLVAAIAPMTLRGLAWAALMSETSSRPGRNHGVQSDEIGQHSVEGSQIALVEPASVAVCCPARHQ